MYKLSRFNYIIEDNDQLIRLYNSLSGQKSLLIVPLEKKEKIFNIFTNCNQKSWFNDCDFLKLCDLGYIVDEELDEISLGLLQKNHIINYPGLLLTIMPTEDCNFRCTYCYENHQKGKMTSDVQNSVVNFVQKNIKNYTMLNVGWFGGEPLEALDVVETLSKRLINICKTARKPYSAGMTTNGYNLSLDTFRLLQQLRVFEFQITVDGLKSTHNKYRPLKDGSETFDRIVNNLLQIRELKRNTFRIDVRTNFTQESASDLSSFLSFCEELFGTDSRFSLFVHLVGNWGGDSIKHMHHDLLTNDSYQHLLNDIIELRPQMSFRAHLRDLEAFHSKCYAGLCNSYVIGADGMIYKCTEGFDMPDNQIGRLTKEGDMIIDQSKHAKWLDCTDSSIISSCSKCKYWGSCLDGSCPKAKIEAQRDPKRNFCPRTQKAVPEIMQLLESSCYEVL